MKNGQSNPNEDLARWLLALRLLMELKLHSFHLGCTRALFAIFARIDAFVRNFLVLAEVLTGRFICRRLGCPRSRSNWRWRLFHLSQAFRMPIFFGLELGWAVFAGFSFLALDTVLGAPFPLCWALSEMIADIRSKFVRGYNPLVWLKEALWPSEI